MAEAIDDPEQSSLTVEVDRDTPVAGRVLAG
jgi:hypothetical protein